MMEPSVLLGITLREEETVLEILKEVGNQRFIELDEELEDIIRRGEQEI
jgi:hypothetical protein